MTLGLVFNVQSFAVHDGPGIRTLAFLKGCPLRCPWCANPESQEFRPEPALILDRCLGLNKCGMCRSACGYGAIGGDDYPVLNRDLCQVCSDFVCRDSCPAEAFLVYGKWLTPNEVMATVLKESVFFQRGGGGLTVSGGEPLSQPDFLLELLALAKKNRLNAALETAGVGSYAVLRRAADFLGTLFYDVKIVDDFKSQRVLGQASAGVLDNLRRLASEKPNLKIIVRVPLVPKVNDDPSAARDLGRFLAKVPNLTWELLPYHRFGEPKYAALNRPNPMGTATLEPLALARFQEEVNAAKALAS